MHAMKTLFVLALVSAVFMTISQQNDDAEKAVVELQLELDELYCHCSARDYDEHEACLAMAGKVAERCAEAKMITVCGQRAHFLKSACTRTASWHTDCDRSACVAVAPTIEDVEAELFDARTTETIGATAAPTRVRQQDGQFNFPIRFVLGDRGKDCVGTCLLANGFCAKNFPYPADNLAKLFQNANVSCVLEKARWSSLAPLGLITDVGHPYHGRCTGFNVRTQDCMATRRSISRLCGCKSEA